MQVCMHETCAYYGKHEQGWTHQLFSQTQEPRADMQKHGMQGQTSLLYVALHLAGLTVNGHASKEASMACRRGRGGGAQEVGADHQQHSW